MREAAGIIHDIAVLYLAAVSQRVEEIASIKGVLIQLKPAGDVHAPEREAVVECAVSYVSRAVDGDRSQPIGALIGHAVNQREGFVSDAGAANEMQVAEIAQLLVIERPVADEFQLSLVEVDACQRAGSVDLIHIGKGKGP